MNVKDLSRKQLRNQILDQLQHIELLEGLIKNHKEIVKQLQRINGDESREAAVQTNLQFIAELNDRKEDSESLRIACLEELNLRNTSSVAQSPTEAFYFPTEFFDGFFLFLEYFPKILLLFNVFWILKSFGIFFKFSIFFHIRWKKILSFFSGIFTK